MTLDNLKPVADLSKAEWRRIALEFKQERDSAKADAMRAFDERNNLLAQLSATKNRGPEQGLPREPTQAMIEATWKLSNAYTTDDDGFNVVNVWKRMYDAALNGQVDSPQETGKAP